MFALKSNHVRFLRDSIAWPKCNETETNKTEMSRDRNGSDQNGSDQNDQTEKSCSDARVIGRSPPQQLDQVCSTRWRLQTNICQTESVLNLFHLLFQMGPALRASCDRINV